MPFSYSVEFRLAACERLLRGEPIKPMAIELGVCEATLFRWKKQFLIDRGRKPGVKSYDVDELARAQRTCQLNRQQTQLLSRKPSTIHFIS